MRERHFGGKGKCHYTGSQQTLEKDQLVSECVRFLVLGEAGKAEISCERDFYLVFLSLKQDALDISGESLIL